MDWYSAATTVAASGVVGRIIDFLLGRAGQERVKDWLAAWWIRFDDVRVGNFGRKEAQFAVQVLDQMVGSYAISPRRLLFTFTTSLTVAALTLWMGAGWWGGGGWLDWPS